MELEDPGWDQQGLPLCREGEASGPGRGAGRQSWLRPQVTDSRGVSRTTAGECSEALGMQACAFFCVKMFSLLISLRYTLIAITYIN